MYGNPDDDFDFEVKDSGKKAEYSDGMRRDTTDGKPRFDLMYPRDIPYDEQLLTRVAMQYQRGGVKYGDRNWEKSSSKESLAHHEAALMRHVIKYLTGTEDGEDHAAAIVWNVNAVDLTRRNIARKSGLEAEIDEYVKTEFRRYNPSTGQYEVTQMGDTERKYWSRPEMDDDYPSGASRLKVENGSISLDPMLASDLVFNENDAIYDRKDNFWTYHHRYGFWSCEDDAEEDGLSITSLADFWGPLKVTAGYHTGKIIGKDGTVTKR